MAKRFCPFSGTQATVDRDRRLRCDCRRSWAIEDVEVVGRSGDGVVAVVPGHRLPRGGRRNVGRSPVRAR